MVMEKIKRIFSGLIFGVILALEITVLADLAAAWLGFYFSRILYLGCFAGLTLLFCGLSWFKGKRLLPAVLMFPAVLAVIGLLLFLFWRSFSQSAVYRVTDNGKNQLYADRRVMLIVPHEDDEINILGGVMEEYVKYGSQVYPVFVTNGDYSGIAETRYAEALAVAEYVGIPKENVTFLGYGDQWKEGGPHIYNAPSGAALESYAGMTQTHGTQVKAAFREGREYTIDHLMEDLEDVILLYRPDTIFCSDYDIHIDHKATTLVFEKVMGKILKADPDYRPEVYKGFAYSASWYSVSDYFTPNISSTVDVFREPLNQQPAIYRWEDRIRLPVAADALSRSIRSSGVYKTLKLHDSQHAVSQADRVINGDRVVWKRDTDSLCYSAQIQASSGREELLNDFMLLENHQLVDESRMPYDGTWIPEAGDIRKTVTVAFPEPVDISCVVLYDNPSEEQNVLDAVIRFADGTGVNTGPLDPSGAATNIRVDKQQISGFSVILMDTEGGQAGLTEIEAYQEMPEDPFAYIKLMDEDENFVYDYWVDRKGEHTFHVYTCGTVGGNGYTLSWDNTLCSAVWENDAIAVNCPAGEEMVLTVSCVDTGISDRVTISNPGVFRRLQCSLGQWMEDHLLQPASNEWFWESMTYEVTDIVRYRLEKLLG